MLGNLFQPLIDRVPAPLRNKFFLALVLFAGWMIFFDNHDILTQLRLQRTVNKLEQDKEFYTNKIEEAREEGRELEINKEKFARERYYMKKQDEDVFIIVKE
jgi:cell division protein DivIC